MLNYGSQYSHNITRNSNLTQRPAFKWFKICSKANNYFLNFPFTKLDKAAHRAFTAITILTGT